MEELNVKEVVLITDSTILYDQLIQLNTQSVGPKHGRHLSELQDSLAATNHKELIETISNGESITLASIRLTPEDFLVRRIEKDGYSVTEESEYIVAISTEISTSLHKEGLIRDLVHHVQGLRRTANFGISDHISIQYEANDSIRETIELFEDYLRVETLADVIESRPPDTTSTQGTFKIGDTSLTLGVQQS